MIKNFIFKIINNDLLNKKYKNIKTRFAPEPNGYLHIGHIKAFLINFNISKIYKGEFNLRFDDTNPDNENIIFVKNIINDLKWLGFNFNNNNIKYASDYFNILFDKAIYLIKKISICWWIIY